MLMTLQPPIKRQRKVVGSSPMVRINQFVPHRNHLLTLEPVGRRFDIFFGFCFDRLSRYQLDDRLNGGLIWPNLNTSMAQ